MSVNKCLCGAVVSVMVYADVRLLVQFMLEVINFSARDHPARKNSAKSLTFMLKPLFAYREVPIHSKNPQKIQKYVLTNIKHMYYAERALSPFPCRKSVFIQI